ncbi:hypothetical protein ASPZODRAFT_60632 [Penicilliopsis zonata CBS 506.65]|uniref:Uncharacterized protein n=1 Tax=Penicilliopsis zonata CBS 506.65 TaxID=1073090 RepID=A0A1L9SPY7_9EURO|nr:hypothetical protein ASPZODRAFT_60632 [Penicilliopsis zonata CBS 506.65]OJJ49238.1 hypothetical protein ASPZODRAFT_60632 [Penicilliopsis zonata CBS 506.65]
MDSMRSLNTSLPSSTPRPQPPEQLLQAFKTAALSVTNLYKNAVCEQAQARQAGYQEAIEDLLTFLDRENLGLGDGEGWRVRQWATERSDGTAPASDDDEQQRGEMDKRARSTSPAATRKVKPEPETVRQPSRSRSPVRHESTGTQSSPPPPQTTTTTTTTTTITNETANPFSSTAIFTFSAGPTMPQYPEQDTDMQPSDTSANLSQDDTVSVSLLPRNARAQHRHGNLSRSSPRAATREPPSVGLGSKRKMPFPDFFDLSGLGNGRDMFGGPKRGRFT